MNVLLKYGAEFANCNHLFYQTKESLKYVYGGEYIEQLTKTQYTFKDDFYQLYTICLDSAIAGKNPNKTASEEIEKLLSKYKLVITKLQHIYEFNVNQNKTTVPRIANMKTR